MAKAPQPLSISDIAIPDSPGRQIIEKWVELLGNHVEFDDQLLQQLREMANKGRLSRSAEVLKLLDSSGKEKGA